MSRLQEITVPAGGQATIDFTAIPATYTHLLLIVQARGDAAGSGSPFVLMQLNGDATASYDTQLAQTYQSTSVGAEFIAQTAGRVGQCVSAGGVAGAFAPTEILLSNYTNTTIRRAWLSSNGEKIADASGGIVTNQFAGEWRNTAAVTRLTLSLSAGNFAAGTVAQLWGIDGPLSGGGLATATATKTTSYAMTTNDGTIFVGAASLTMTLPTPVGVAGRQYLVKNQSAATNTTIATAAGTIDGAATQPLTAAYAALLLESDNTNWLIVGKV